MKFDKHELEQMIEEAATEHASYGAETIMGYQRFAPISAEDYKCGAKSMLPLIENLQRQNTIFREYAMDVRDHSVKPFQGEKWHNYAHKYLSEALTKADSIAKELETK